MRKERLLVFLIAATMYGMHVSNCETRFMMSSLCLLTGVNGLEQVPGGEGPEPVGSHPLIHEPLDPVSPVPGGLIGAADRRDRRLSKAGRIRGHEVDVLQGVAPLGHLGRDVGGSDRLDLDVVRLVLVLQGLAEVLDELLGSRVDTHEREGTVAGDGGDVDHQSPPLGHHEWQDRSCDHQRGCNVHPDVGPEAHLILVQEPIRGIVHHTRIVDQDPDVPGNRSRPLHLGCKIRVRLRQSERTNQREISYESPVRRGTITDVTD